MQRRLWPAMIAVLAGALATPALADRDRDRDRDHHHRHGHHHDRNEPRKPQPQRHAYCPPGLIQQGRACIPPGYKLTRKQPRVGDVLRTRDYRRLDDPMLYALQHRQGWNYYRDDRNIYRVDSSTRKILAVMELVSAFSQ